MSSPVPSGAVVTPAGKRGRKPGSAARVRPEIPASEFVIENIEDDSRGYLKRQRLERTAQQIAVDAKVQSVKNEWEAVGSAADWNKMPVKGWVISRNLEDDALFLLGKAVRLHGYKLVTGNIQRKALPKLPLPEGKIRIPFCVVSRKTEVTGLPAESEGRSSDTE